jgi:thiol:disulfide interchange protein DsbD
MRSSRFIITLVTFFSFLISLHAQIFNPVSWTYQWKNTTKNEYELQFIAQIDDGWNIYSQYLESDDGPIRTSIIWDKGSHYTLLGKAAEEGNIYKGFDDIFGMNVIRLSGKIIFRQKIRVTDPSKPITGFIEYMACDKERCLPPGEANFSFQVTASDDAQANVTTSTTSGDNTQYSPEIPVVETPESEDKTVVQKGDFNLNKPGLPINSCDSDGASVSPNTDSYFNLFLLGFLGGLLALLTPCVFPMIPLTVSYFTKGSEDRKKGVANAFLYGFFIFLVYLLLSVPFHLMDSIQPDILNDISTNVGLNLFFFIIFIVFALSFFGYFELALPESWTNKASSAEGIGGIIGIFFMALTLALVSFSCTGPILGSLLAGTLSSSSGAMQLTAGMGGFGLALALPFGLFAAFPGLLNRLPKSGGWMNSVKVVLGFLELALALKFLSNADLVKHWGLVKIEVFLGVWIIIFSGLSLYLFGVFRIGHESASDKRSLTHHLLGFTGILFVAYLVSGFRFDERAGTYRSLTALSGMAPPTCYSLIYDCQCPHNLQCFKDLETGIAYAKEVNKPIMLDFTGYACVNCRKMEEHVWPEPGVYSMLNDNYVLISLYVDDKTLLPEDQQKTVTQEGGKSRKLRTIGNKWSYLQTSYFRTNSQPYYALLSPDGKLLNKPVAYTPEASTYADFLKCGLDAFEKVKEQK